MKTRMVIFHIIGIIVIMSASVGITGLIYTSDEYKALNTKMTATTVPTATPEAIAGYEVGTLLSGAKAEFDVNLKGDSSNLQKVTIYVDKPGTTLEAGQIIRSKPVRIEVSDKGKSVFSYIPQGDVAENEFGDAKILKHFTHDNKDILLVELISTGYGSGSATYLDFVEYDGNAPSAPQDPQSEQYRVIQGPILSELDKYSIDSERVSILVARAFYSEDPSVESHFDPHGYEFFRYIWNVDNYLEGPSLGKTEGKYIQTQTIEEILNAEPNLKTAVVTQ